MPDQVFCSEFSLTVGESIVATATHVDVWLCLEYSGPWGRNALKDSELPEAVKAHLTASEKSIPNARVELIKQERKRASEAIGFFVALSSEIDPRVYQFSLTSYEDLLDLDLEQIVSRTTKFDSYVLRESLILVCTNGKRDQCCARSGIVMYHALAKEVGDRAWQCTHLGGHRFAANVVVLPSGIVYGRAAPDHAKLLADSSRVELPLFRGRSCFAEAAQAAEIFLHEKLSDSSSIAIEVSAQNPIGDAQWEIILRRDGKSYRVCVAKVPAGFGTYVSCGEDELKDANKFELLSLAEE